MKRKRKIQALGRIESHGGKEKSKFRREKKHLQKGKKIQVSAEKKISFWGDKSLKKKKSKPEEQKNATVQKTWASARNKRKKRQA